MTLFKPDFKIKKPMNKSVIVLIMTSLLFTACLHRREYTITVNFDDTNFHHTSFELNYGLWDSEVEMIKSESLDPESNQKTKTVLPENSFFISLYIMDQPLPLSSKVYANSLYLNRETMESEFYVVSPLKFELLKTDDDMLFHITNKKHSDYNILTLYSENNTCEAQYLINKKQTQISLRELEKSPIYSVISGYNTDSALTLITGTFETGRTYRVEIQAVKKQSYNSLKIYSPSSLFKTQEFIYELNP